MARSISARLRLVDGLSVVADARDAARTRGQQFLAADPQFFECGHSGPLGPALCSASPLCDAHLRRDIKLTEWELEEFFQALGMIGLIFLVVVGVLAGFLASAVQGGRNKVRNIVVGVVGALLLPFVVAVLATGVLAAGSLVLILVVALIGAVAVLAIVRLIFR